MQTHDPDPTGALLARVVGQAMAEARWERLDLLSRRPADLVPDLLNGRAAELYGSARGRDQLLAVALEHVVRGDTTGAGVDAVLGPAPTEADRLALRRLAAAQDLPVMQARALVDALEARHCAPARRPPAPADALSVEADLNELLWDDPRIRADLEVRLIMMCSVMKLRDRVDRLRAQPRRISGVASRLPLVGPFMRGPS